MIALCLCRFVSNFSQRYVEQMLTYSSSACRVVSNWLMAGGIYGRMVILQGPGEWEAHSFRKYIRRVSMFRHADPLSTVCSRYGIRNGQKQRRVLRRLCDLSYWKWKLSPLGNLYHCSLRIVVARPEKRRTDQRCYKIFAKSRSLAGHTVKRLCFDVVNTHIKPSTNAPVIIELEGEHILCLWVLEQTTQYLNTRKLSDTVGAERPTVFRITLHCLH